MNKIQIEEIRTDNAMCWHYVGSKNALDRLMKRIYKDCASVLSEPMCPTECDPFVYQNMSQSEINKTCFHNFHVIKALLYHEYGDLALSRETDIFIATHLDLMVNQSLASGEHGWSEDRQQRKQEEVKKFYDLAIKMVLVMHSQGCRSVMTGPGVIEVRPPTRFEMLFGKVRSFWRR